jgi:hypothetical protein
MEETSKREERLKSFLQLLHDYRLVSKTVKDNMRYIYKVKDNKAKFGLSPLMKFQ